MDIDMLRHDIDVLRRVLEGLDKACDLLRESYNDSIDLRDKKIEWVRCELWTLWGIATHIRNRIYELRSLLLQELYEVSE